MVLCGQDTSARQGILEHYDDLLVPPCDVSWSWAPPVGPISAQWKFQANGLIFGGKVNLAHACQKQLRR